MFLADPTLADLPLPPLPASAGGATAAAAAAQLFRRCKVLALEMFSNSGGLLPLDPLVLTGKARLARTLTPFTPNSTSKNVGM